MADTDASRKGQVQPGVVENERNVGMTTTDGRQPGQDPAGNAAAAAMAQVPNTGMGQGLGGNCGNLQSGEREAGAIPDVLVMHCGRPMEQTCIVNGGCAAPWMVVLGRAES